MIEEETSAPLPSAAWALLAAMRPKQWVKNASVFIPLFFTVNEAWQIQDFGSAAVMVGRSAAAFVLFTAISSAVYLINDVVDGSRDRRHPKKRFRPIAAGRLSPRAASAGAAVLALAGLGLAYVLSPGFALTAGVYFAVMAAYTFVLKKVPLLDVATISGGFTLRVVSGALAIAAPVSVWLYVCTSLAALLLALAKRYSELEAAGAASAEQRSVLTSYSPRLLNALMLFSALAGLAAYSVYSLTARNLPDNHAMAFTIPFVFLGLLRYLFLVRVNKLGENPEDVLLSDRPLMLAIAAWLVTAGAVLALFR